MNFLISSHGNFPKNGSQNEEQQQNYSFGLRKCSEIALVTSLTNAAVYPFNLTHKFNLVGFEPIQSQQIIAKNGKITMSYPNCLKNAKNLYDVFGPSILYRGFFLECGISSFCIFGEVFMDNLLNKLEKREIIANREEPVNVPHEKSFKSFLNYFKSICFKFVINNVQWLIPLVIAYPLISTLNCYVVAAVTRDSLYQSFPCALSSIMQKDGILGFYYGFKSYVSYEFLYRTLLKAAGELYNYTTSGKRIPGQIDSLTMEQLAQIGASQLYSTSFLMSINRPSSRISNDPLVMSATCISGTLQALFATKYAHRSALFFRTFEINHSPLKL